MIMDICGDCNEEISPYFTHQCKGPQVGLFDAPPPDAVTVDGPGGRVTVKRGEVLERTFMSLPPHVPGSDTSKAAAESMRGRAQTDHSRVLHYITQQGTAGATADEVLVALDLTHQNGSARVSTLAKLRQIRDSDRRRKTRSGRMAAVYVATGYEPTLAEAMLKANFDRDSKAMATTAGVTVEDVGFVRLPSPAEPSAEDFRDFHSMVGILLENQTGGQRGPMTERVMLWLKHLGDQ